MLPLAANRDAAFLAGGPDGPTSPGRRRAAHADATASGSIYLSIYQSLSLSLQLIASARPNSILPL